MQLSEAFCNKFSNSIQLCWQTVTFPSSKILTVNLPISFSNTDYLVQRCHYTNTLFNANTGTFLILIHKISENEIELYGEHSIATGVFSIGY